LAKEEPLARKALFPDGGTGRSSKKRCYRKKKGKKKKDFPSGCFLLSGEMDQKGGTLGVHRTKRQNKKGVLRQILGERIQKPNILGLSSFWIFSETDQKKGRGIGVGFSSGRWRDFSP